MGDGVDDEGNHACDVQAVERVRMSCLECMAENAGEFCRFSATIPHFGCAEIVSYACDECGYAYRKVRTGLGFPSSDENAVGESFSSRGKVITLNVCDVEDLKREVVKSDSCTLIVPELELEVEERDGAYTTVDGLVTGTAQRLRFVKCCSWEGGVGAEHISGSKFEDFFKRSSALVEKALAAPRGSKTAVFTVVLKDPMGASFISPREGRNADDEDIVLTIKEYDRTQQEDEDVGINSSNQGTGSNASHGNEMEDGETVEQQCGTHERGSDAEEPKREYSDQTWMDALNILAMHELAIEGSGEESVDVQQWLAVQQKQQDEDARRADEEAARHGGKRLVERLEHVERIDVSGDSSEKDAAEGSFSDDVLEQFESID